MSVRSSVRPSVITGANIGGLFLHLFIFFFKYFFFSFDGKNHYFSIKRIPFLFFLIKIEPLLSKRGGLLRKCIPTETFKTGGFRLKSIPILLIKRIHIFFRLKRIQIFRLKWISILSIKNNYYFFRLKCGPTFKKCGYIEPSGTILRATSAQSELVFALKFSILLIEDFSMYLRLMCTWEVGWNNIFYHFNSNKKSKKI